MLVGRNTSTEVKVINIHVSIKRSELLCFWEDRICFTGISDTITDRDAEIEYSGSQND